MRQNNLPYRLACVVVLWSAFLGPVIAVTFSRPDTSAIAMADSMAPQPLGADSTSYETPRPRDFNGLRYTLDGYHRYRGDTLRGGNTFLEFGGGLLLQRHVNNGHYDPTYLVHLRVGRQFSALHSVRVGFTAGLGTLKSGLRGTERRALQRYVGAEADYLFHLSDYLYGYRPERPLQLSLLVGGALGSYRLAGSRRHLMNQLERSAFSYSVHGGLQLKLFSGRHAALVAEPYVQVANAASDLSDTGHRNWHRFTVSGGVNLSYVYYFRDVLTPAALCGDFQKRYARGQRWLREDGGGQQPAPFVSYGLGGALLGYDLIGAENWHASFGPTYAVAAGGWLSSALGLRATLSATNSDCRVSEGRTQMQGYVAAGVDALLNPLGFRRYYRPDAPAGINLLVGLEYGWLRRTDDTHTSSHVLGTRVGLEPWVRLCRGTRLFVEPTYTVLFHRMGDAAVSYDSQVSLRLGLELTLDRRPVVATGGSQREASAERTDAPGGILRGRLLVGAGGGWNTTFQRWRYSGGGNGVLKNGLLFADYRLGALSGVMLSGEYLTERFQQARGREKFEHWMLSASYRLDLSTLLTGREAARPVTVSALAGPTLALHGGPARMGAHLGLRVDCQLADHYGLFAEQRYYLMSDDFYGQAPQLSKPLGTLLTSLNVGVSCRL